MSGMNKVILIGNLTKDPETRRSPPGLTMPLAKSQICRINNQKGGAMPDYDLWLAGLDARVIKVLNAMGRTPRDLYDSLKAELARIDRELENG